MAIDLAQLGKYSARPNPCVGAVIARGNHVRAIGWHMRYGDRHAERVALDQLETINFGDTIYVTLEPCAHQGKQPSCADLLIERGVHRVIVGMTDPNPLTNGEGIQRLRDAGVAVEVVDDESVRQQLLDLNPGFISVHERGRPYVTYKWAETSDGKMSTGDPDRRWISGETSRRDVQRLRAESGAVLVGVQTVVEDDPQLTVRGSFAHLIVQQPLRVVVDRNLRTPINSYLVQSARWHPTLIATQNEDLSEHAAFTDLGVAVWFNNDPSDFLPNLFKQFATLGVNDVLVESGPTLARNLFAHRLLDRLICYQSPDDAPNGLPGFEVTHPMMQIMQHASTAQFGGDRRLSIDVTLA